MISNRIRKLTKTPNFMYEGWKKHQDNPFDANTNPNGMINLGVSENKLIGEEILGKLSTIDYKNLDESYTHYCSLTGTEKFRQTLAEFFTKFMKPKLDITDENVFVMNGCGTVVETLGVAICDKGEGFLVPAPYYSSFKSDLEARFNTKLVPVKLSAHSDVPFQLTYEKLQDSYNEAVKNGIPIKGLLISNPINPLGITYNIEELETCLEFCLEHDMHLVCDEIYMLSVYDNESSFTNLLSLKNIAKYKDIVHVIWGFSKDFALSGFRCGVAITFNNEMKEALLATAYYTSVPTATQHTLTELISDYDWIRQIQKVNHKRLRTVRDIADEGLTEAHIPFLVPNSGLFLVFNVLNYMKKQTFEEEMRIYKKFVDNGIFILPGQLLEFSEPGWFRLIIANDSDAVSTGIRRIVNSLNDQLDDEK